MDDPTPPGTKHGGVTTTGPDATHPLTIFQNLGGGGQRGWGGGRIQGPGPAPPPVGPNNRNACVTPAALGKSGGKQPTFRTAHAQRMVRPQDTIYHTAPHQTSWSSPLTPSPTALHTGCTTWHRPLRNTSLPPLVPAMQLQRASGVASSLQVVHRSASEAMHQQSAVQTPFASVPIKREKYTSWSGVGHTT